MGKLVRLVRRSLALMAPLLVLSGFVVLSGSTPAGADTTTFSSASVGSSGATPNFSESGPWTLSWNYNCSGNQGEFIVTVVQPEDSFNFDVGPEAQGTGSSGEDYFYDTGQFSLQVVRLYLVHQRRSQCSGSSKLAGHLHKCANGVHGEPTGIQCAGQLDDVLELSVSERRDRK